MTKVITANNLTTGHVVFLGPGDMWVASIDDAVVFEDVASTEASMARARQDAERAIIVDPFVTGTGTKTDGKAAMTLRDSIRAYGPTIHYLPSDEKPAPTHRPA